jgi:hypothetical protein
MTTNKHGAAILTGLIAKRNMDSVAKRRKKMKYSEQRSRTFFSKLLTAQPTSAAP